MHAAFDKDGKHGRAGWGKHCSVQAGDLVTITLDMKAGLMRMDVPGKFKVRTMHTMHARSAPPATRHVPGAQPRARRAGHRYEAARP
jgi:hypothetical protein